MTTREITISVVDFLVWCGAGAAILAFAILVARALYLGHVHINGHMATKRKEPVGYLLVIVSFCGVIYFLWPVFWGGLSSWLAQP